MQGRTCSWHSARTLLLPLVLVREFFGMNVAPSERIVYSTADSSYTFTKVGWPWIQAALPSLYSQFVEKAKWKYAVLCCGRNINMNAWALGDLSMSWCPLCVWLIAETLSKLGLFLLTGSCPARVPVTWIPALELASLTFHVMLTEAERMYGVCWSLRRCPGPRWRLSLDFLILIFFSVYNSGLAQGFLGSGMFLLFP